MAPWSRFQKKHITEFNEFSKRVWKISNCVMPSLMPSAFIWLGKYFSNLKKILGLSKAIGVFESPLPCNGKFECSIHIFRGLRFTSHGNIMGELTLTYGTPQGTPMVQLQIMMIPIKFGNINSTSLESRSWLWKIYLFIMFTWNICLKEILSKLVLVLIKMFWPRFTNNFPVPPSL